MGETGFGGWKFAHFCLKMALRASGVGLRLPSMGFRMSKDGVQIAIDGVQNLAFEPPNPIAEAPRVMAQFEKARFVILSAGLAESKNLLIRFLACRGTGKCMRFFDCVPFAWANSTALRMTFSK